MSPQACEVANEIIDRAPRNVMAIQTLLDPSALQRLVDALVHSVDFRLQRLLTELLFRSAASASSTMAATAAVIRSSVATQLRAASADAATAFERIRSAHFEADCRAFQVTLNHRAAATGATAGAIDIAERLRSVRGLAVYYCGQALAPPVDAATTAAVPPSATPASTRQGTARRAAPLASTSSRDTAHFWIDFNVHGISFEARLPGEDDHDLVEVPYSKLSHFDFERPTDGAAPTTAPGTTALCLRLLLSSAPSILRHCGGQGEVKQNPRNLIRDSAQRGVGPSLSPV